MSAGREHVGYAEPTYPSPSFDEGLVGSMMERAVAEQIAEQRLIREALTDFDRRLEILERTVADRLALVEREGAERTDRFERAVTERMLAFEIVLKRIVERLATTEERIVDAVDHGGRVTRTQIEALRPMVEESLERMAEAAEESERTVGEAVAQARRRLEATVQEAMEAQLQGAIDEFRESLETAERKIRRDVNRVTFAVLHNDDTAPEAAPVVDDAGDSEDDGADEGRLAVHAEPVVDPEAEQTGPMEGAAETSPSNGASRKRRRRPLRARRDDD